MALLALQTAFPVLVIVPAVLDAGLGHTESLAGVKPLPTAQTLDLTPPGGDETVAGGLLLSECPALKVLGESEPAFAPVAVDIAGVDLAVLDGLQGVLLADLLLPEAFFVVVVEVEVVAVLALAAAVLEVDGGAVGREPLAGVDVLDGVFAAGGEVLVLEEVVEVLVLLLVAEVEVLGEEEARLAGTAAELGVLAAVGDGLELDAFGLVRGELEALVAGLAGGFVENETLLDVGLLDGEAGGALEVVEPVALLAVVGGGVELAVGDLLGLFEALAGVVEGVEAGVAFGAVAVYVRFEAVLDVLLHTTVVFEEEEVGEVAEDTFGEGFFGGMDTFEASEVA